MNGGYVMIDAKGLDLTKGSTSQTIAGIYNEVKKSFESDKPIFVYNCVWGSDSIVSPIQIFCVDFGDYIIATASTLQIVVTKADGVTIVNMVETDSDGE